MSGSHLRCDGNDAEVSVKMTPLAHKHVRAITEGWRRRSCNSLKNNVIRTELLFIRAPNADEELYFSLELRLQSWLEFTAMIRNNQNHVFSFTSHSSDSDSLIHLQTVKKQVFTSA